MSGCVVLSLFFFSSEPVFMAFMALPELLLSCLARYGNEDLCLIPVLCITEILNVECHLLSVQICPHH